MKDWFAGLEPRERLLVSGGGVVLLVLLLYLMIWEPIAGNYRALNDGVAEQKKTLAWMKQAAAELKLLQRRAPVLRAVLAVGPCYQWWINRRARVVWGRPSNASNRRAARASRCGWKASHSIR